MQPNGKVKWQFEADYLQACNCHFGCPCEFEAPPTMGFCEGGGIWRINRGRYGDVPLDGLAVGFAAHWPKAIHEGNGTAVVFCDERANEDQRHALISIASGEAGGLPFEIIATTFSKVLDPQFVRFDFEANGKQSHGRAGDRLQIAVQPIRNPVTGSEESVKIVHETGFIFKSAECVASAECRCDVEGLTFSWPNRAAFVTQVRYGN